MEHIMELINSNELEIIAFYPYTSIVINRLMEENHNYETKEAEFLQRFGSAMITKLNNEHPTIKWDNKVVIEFRVKNDIIGSKKQSSLFLGWKDNKWSLGLGMWQPDDFTAKYNKIFIEV